MVKVSRTRDIHIAARGTEVHAAFVITYFWLKEEPTDEATN